MSSPDSSQAAGPSVPAPGESILKDTIAEMTYPEIEAAIARGAIGLWGLGVIEQHGPHLPTATDVYIPSVRLRTVRKLLAAGGIESLVLPPFYWGVNHVSGSFPASFRVRPQVMIDLIVDVMKSLAGDGLKTLFCVSGHNDRAHNAAIFEGIRQGASESGLAAAFIAEEGMIRRLNVDLQHPNVLPFHVARAEEPPPFVDVHAGEWETSVMLACNPEVVRADKLKGLAPTNLGPADLAEWRKGFDEAKRVTPLGYFGDPASASAARGREQILAEAGVIAAAIKQRLNP